MRNRIILAIACIFSFLMFAPLGNAQEETINGLRFDHYLGYSTRTEWSRVYDQTVTIEDQFSKDDYLLAPSKGITHFNPALKLRYDIKEENKVYLPFIHLEGVPVIRKTGEDMERSHNIKNQFGEFVVKTGAAKRFLVPSIKIHKKVTSDFDAPRECTDEFCDGKLPEHVVNHFLCYEILNQDDFPPIKVGVYDQFRDGFDEFIGLRATQFCNPARKKLHHDDAKWEETPSRGNHLTCYAGGVKERTRDTEYFAVISQLGIAGLNARANPGEFCVPTIKEEPPICGDGIVGNTPGETCDPPGPIPDSDRICREDCTFCGDKVVDPGEECDDGNGNNKDGCRNNCTIPVCGDKITDEQLGETCDGQDFCRPPGDPDECTFCGDRKVQGDEECDDGPSGSDTCTPECTTIKPPKPGACCLEVPKLTTGGPLSCELLTEEECLDQGGDFVDGLCREDTCKDY